MANFLFIYRHGEQQATTAHSPEEMQATMAKWGAWFGKVGAAIVDGGDGLLPNGKVVRSDAITDGPFIEAKELVGGYSILQAESYDEVVAHAKSCPVLENGGTVEIRQLAGFSTDGS